MEKTLPNENSLQKKNERTTLVFEPAIKAQSKNNCADKHMESQTNHN